MLVLMADLCVEWWSALNYMNKGLKKNITSNRSSSPRPCEAPCGFGKLPARGFGLFQKWCTETFDHYNGATFFLNVMQSTETLSTEISVFWLSFTNLGESREITVFFPSFWGFFLFFIFFLEKGAPRTSTNIKLITVGIYFTFGGNMLCSQDNMPATQRMNMMQPILPFIYPFSPLKTGYRN